MTLEDIAAKVSGTVEVSVQGAEVFSAYVGDPTSGFPLITCRCEHRTHDSPRPPSQMVVRSSVPLLLLPLLRYRIYRGALLGRRYRRTYFGGNLLLVCQETF